MAAAEVSGDLVLFLQGHLVGVGKSGRLGELVATDGLHHDMAVAASDPGQGHRQQHAALTHLDFEVAHKGLGAVNPGVNDLAADHAVAAVHRLTAWIGVTLVKAVIGRNAQGHYTGFAVDGEVGNFRPRRISGGTDAIHLRVTRGVQGRARCRVHRFGRQRVRRRIWPWYHAIATAVGQPECLRLRHRGEALDFAPGTGFKRIALPLGLSVQPEDQSEKEQPEYVQHHLGDVDVTGNSAGFHSVFSLRYARLSGELRQAESGL